MTSTTNIRGIRRRGENETTQKNNSGDGFNSRCTAYLILRLHGRTSQCVEEFT